MNHLLIVEDHRLVLDGLLMLLTQRFEGAKIDGVQTLAAALEVVAAGAPDVVLLDCYLPDATASTSVRKLRELAPNLLIIVLTGEPDEKERKIALDAGASAFLSKRTEAQLLVQTIEQVAKGGLVPDSARAPDMSIPGLTPRQMMVLSCIERGLTNKEVAAEIGSAEATVRVHTTAIFRVLGVSNRTEAANEGRRRRGAPPV